MIYIIFIILILLLLLYIFHETNIKNTVEKTHLGNEYIIEQLKEIHKKLDQNEIKQLQQMEEKTLKWKVLIILTTILSIFFLFISLKLENENAMKTIFVITLILVTCMIYAYQKNKRKYAVVYKQKIITNIIKLVEPELKYYPYGKNEEKNQTTDEEDIIITDNIEQETEIKEAYDKANFDNKKYNKYYEDDYIEGVIKNEIYIKMANIKTIQEKQQIDESTAMKSKTKIVQFEGIFVEAYVDNDIETRIKITKNKNSKQKVEMDNAEFEKRFDVFTEDRILAMRILTHDVMEEMIQFYDKIKYEIVIIENKIYIRFLTGETFEPKINGKAKDEEALVTYYSILKFIIEVTTKLNKEIKNLET